MLSRDQRHPDWKKVRKTDTKRGRVACIKPHLSSGGGGGGGGGGQTQAQSKRRLTSFHLRIFIQSSASCAELA